MGFTLPSAGVTPAPSIKISDRNLLAAPWFYLLSKQSQEVSSMDTQSTHARIIPGMRYRNAPAAIEWLCKAFGFEKHVVVPDQDGGIAHAQLSFGDGMIMLGSVGGGMFGRLMKHPDEIGGCETHSTYVIVADSARDSARTK